MSTYYQYQDVSVMIAHKLMNMEGWKVYGYHADESDSMTDYYSPAYWNGIAEKNGYILVYNESREAKPEEIRKYNYDGKLTDVSISDKIQKLQQMTVERGASEAEAKTAKNMIEKLQVKQSASNENFVVVGVRPGHLANPPKCNWHIEKDGIIIAKGNGLLKYSEIDSYYKYDHYMEDMQLFRTMDREAYKQKLIDSNMRRWNETEERAIECADSYIKEMEGKSALMDQFEAFINKIDTTCGALLGSGDGYIYEKVTVTEYKKENKAVITESGSIKDGQCFIVKTSFNYGHNKGYVYRIHVAEYEGRKSYHAVKLNGKLTKECDGTANQSNHWYMTDNFIRWFEKGSLAWCDITEVKTPYEVEKVVKKIVKAETESTTEQQSTKESKAEQPETTDINALHYDIKEDTDTRDNSKIFVVKVIEKLDRDEYIKVNNNMKSIGGYYSKFKHGFIFKNDPSELLNGDIKQDAQAEHEQKQAKQQQLTDKINKQIESTQKKIDALSGEYKTNTWKRMNEQASRDSKIEGYQQDINILQYLIDTLENRALTPLEENLIISSFRDEIDVYYRRNEAYNKPNRGTALTPIEFPKINYSSPLDGWWNKEVPAKQKRLQKANIYNTDDLFKAVEEYKGIYALINKPCNYAEKKIKQLEREYKMQQKGDINFTPSEVAEQLIQYTKIDSNSRVLEPSAGIGNIADQIKQHTNNIDVCEQMYHFSELLKLKGYNVVGNDFLEYETTNKYDAIIMNPPFSDEIRHIKHAYELLKDGGILVAISSPHWTFANDKQSVEFREWLENETYFTEDLKGGTFEMTGVSTKIIVIEKHEQAESKTA